MERLPYCGDVEAPRSAAADLLMCIEALGKCRLAEATLHIRRSVASQNPLACTPCSQQPWWSIDGPPLIPPKHRPQQMPQVGPGQAPPPCAAPREKSGAHSSPSLHTDQPSG
jgi:hypothetical protein